MLEGVADVVSLYDLERAVSTGVKHSQVIISSIAQLQQQFGKSKMAVDPTPKLEPDVVNLLCRLVVDIGVVICVSVAAATAPALYHCYGEVG